jgi:hypothetical protein
MHKALWPTAPNKHFGIRIADFGLRIQDWGIWLDCGVGRCQLPAAGLVLLL